MAKPAKTPSESHVEATHLVLPGDTNALDTLFGGKLVEWIDIAAAVAARRHCEGVAVTVSVDSLQFLHPIQIGDVVILRASVNRAWKTSMEVGVRAEVESIDGRIVVAASAFLTFVALAEDHTPRPVPPIDPQTADERRRFEAALQRRDQRLSQRSPAV